MIKFAFLLGIVFISFNLIWFLFTSALKMILGQTGVIEKYILRITQGYFLASVTALTTIEYTENGNSFIFLMAIGVVVLFLYLINKIEQRKKRMEFNLQFNKDYVQFNSSNLKYDILIAVFTVGFYIAGVISPYLVDNPLNNWLFRAIHNLYDTFFIGAIISIIGVFFIISIFIKALNSFQLIYSQFSQIINGGKKSSSNTEDGFTEYEIVEEEEERESFRIENKD